MNLTEKQAAMFQRQPAPPAPPALPAPAYEQVVRLLKEQPEMSLTAIGRLLGRTKERVRQIANKSGLRISNKRARAKRDLTGQRFGKLLVLSRSERKKKDSWRCLCDCGVEKKIRGVNLTQGTKSCGCLLSETMRVHGQAGRTPEYQVWAAIIQRCTNPNNPSYPRYGGRGVTVCERWRDSFEAFYEDMGDRPEGKRPSGRAFYSIHRAENAMVYSKKTCVWATQKEQCAEGQRRQKRVPEGFKHKGASSQFLGVSFHKPSGRWFAFIRVNRKLKYVGQFKTEMEAALARDAAVIEHDTKQRLNFQPKKPMATVANSEVNVTLARG